MRKDGPFVVGFAGSLKPWHGIEYLVRAFKRLRRISEDYRLLIVGDGPLRAQLQREIGRNGWRDAATLTGAVEIEEVARLLTRMDVATAPYPPLRGFYFSPLKVFEYMAAGVPIVASDIGQIGEILTHRRTALLHRAGAVDEIAARIDELRRKPALAAGLAREARALLCRRYTWRRNADRVLSSIAAARRKLRARKLPMDVVTALALLDAEGMRAAVASLPSCADAVAGTGELAASWVNPGRYFNTHC